MKRGAGLIALVWLLIPVEVSAVGGTLTLNPLSATSQVGETFSVEIVVDSGGKAVNAIEAELSFNPAALAVVGISTARSMFASWPTQPEYSNIDGTLRFAGWASSPFVAQRERVVVVTFRGLSAAQSPLRFTSGALLSPEGQETNILSLMESGAYRVETRIVSAVEPPVSTMQRIIEPSEPLVASAMPVPPTVPPGTDLVRGERIIIRGTSGPSLRVMIWTQYESEPEMRTELYSTLDGTFTYVSEELTRVGTYRVWAASEDAAGVRSVSSPVQTYVVMPEASQSAAAAGAEIGWAALPFFSMIALFGFLYIYATRTRKPE